MGMLAEPYRTTSSPWTEISTPTVATTRRAGGLSARPTATRSRRSPPTTPASVTAATRASGHGHPCVFQSSHIT